MADEQDIPAGICACGCGQPTKRVWGTNRPRGLVAGTYHKYKKGHARRGLPTNGYRSARQPDGEIGYLHRVRAEAAVGHPLPKGAIVHHPDEDPWNPDARLVICPDDAYHMLLHVRMRIKTAGGNPNTDKICCRCKQVLPRTAFGKLTSSADGLNNRCRKCACQYTSESQTRRCQRALCLKIQTS